MKLLSLSRGCFTTAMATTKSAWGSKAAVLIVTLMAVFTGLGKYSVAEYYLYILDYNVSTQLPPKSRFRRCRPTSPSRASCFPPERLDHQFSMKIDFYSIAFLLPNKRGSHRWWTVNAFHRAFVFLVY